jgi:hypothetical protein
VALHDRIQKMRADMLELGKAPVPAELQGVTKNRIRDVLELIDRSNADTIDVTYALLDDTQSSWFSNAPGGARFSDAASTAHIACHVGILQRGKGKLDREGRDYWLKPLWEIGAIEKAFLDSKNGRFVAGHPVAKSSNCAYRLSSGLVAILKAPEGTWKTMLASWAKEDDQRRRLALQAEEALRVGQEVTATHAILIAQALAIYVPRFLPDFEPLYVDDGDGERITAADRERLEAAGLELKLEDSIPDVLLWNRATDRLWILEAVASDGEVDRHKVEQIAAIVKRSKKTAAGFTTIYPTWRVAAARQGKFKNVPASTYIWILEDPSRCFKVEEQPGP